MKDVDELVQDFELLVNNAKAFYKPETTEHQDAVALWQNDTAHRQKLLEYRFSDDDPKKRGCRRLTCTADEDGTGNKKDDLNLYEELFASVMTSVDSTMNDRPLHRMFLLLPSKKMYPGYYDVIEHPIDLRLTAKKIQTNAYSNLQEVEKDVCSADDKECLSIQ
ncbi:protein polybromo-1-like [Musca autumnalis]|uniref:protein polybromo-1-like n=1 Tax=Musca autumnalis TaxID=221902 RepID=UPI003CF7ECFE